MALVDFDYNFAISKIFPELTDSGNVDGKIALFYYKRFLKNIFQEIFWKSVRKAIDQK